MIKTNHTIFGHQTIGRYIRQIVKKDFRTLQIHSDCKFDIHKPVILLPNHISWWDGFWLYTLNQKIWKRKFHLMMLESELKKHKIFSQIGAFSINPGSRSVIETFNYTLSLTEKQENLIVIYPQGKIYPQQAEGVKFQSGILKLLRKIDNCDIINVATFVNYGSHRKPQVDIFLERCEDLEKIEDSYNQFYKKSKDGLVL
jgi:hypothetical protein